VPRSGDARVSSLSSQSFLIVLELELVLVLGSLKADELLTEKKSGARSQVVDRFR
jgi:hypothetical protein